MRNVVVFCPQCGKEIVRYHGQESRIPAPKPCDSCLRHNNAAAAS